MLLSEEEPEARSDVRGVCRGWLGENGIIHLVLGDEETFAGRAFSRADAEDARAVSLGLGDAPPFYVLADARSLRRTTSEARRTPFNDPRTVLAILVGNAVTRMLAYAFQGFSQRTVSGEDYPTKVFSDRGKAIAWLEKHQEAHRNKG